MSTIKLISTSGQGFLSFYDPFQFDIFKYEGKATQIDGVNRSDDISKSNGGGKSSLLESVGWGLYGELCRKNHFKDEVIYNRNGVKAKFASISTNFEEGENSYHTTRKLEWKKSPELVLIENGEEILKGATYSTKQEHLEKILGMNFTAFQCCEMFGGPTSGFLCFPDLKPSERAKVLTDIRGLDKYVQASEKCSKQIKNIQISVREKTEESRTLEGRISQLREIDYKSKIQEFEDDRKKELEEIKIQEINTKKLLKEIENKVKEEVNKLRNQIEEYEKKEKKNENLLIKLPSFREKYKGLAKDYNIMVVNKHNIEQRALEIVQERKDFQKLGVGKCPICKQKITGDHLAKEISNLNLKISGFTLKAKELDPKILETKNNIEKVEQDTEYLSKLESENKEIRNLIYRSKTTILSLEKAPELQRHRITLENLKVSSEALKNDENPYKKQEEERKSTLFVLVNQFKGVRQDMEALEQEGQYYQFWIDGFKSIRNSLFGIIIDRFHELTQDLLSQYSSELQVQFSTERETRSGTIKEEFNISITDSSGTTLSYEMYSGGEKQKIRLSIAMALAQMIKDDCGKSYNGVFFDEPNDALDDVGKEINFNLFKEIAESGQVVFVTDHDELFKSRFDHSITVVKENDKSFIQEGYNDYS